MLTEKKKKKVRKQLKPVYLLPHFENNIRVTGSPDHVPDCKVHPFLDLNSKQTDPVLHFRQITQRSRVLKNAKDLFTFFFIGLLQAQLVEHIYTLKKDQQPSLSQFAIVYYFIQINLSNFYELESKSDVYFKLYCGHILLIKTCF